MHLLGSVLFCAGATIVLKITFLACGHAWGSSIESPSAHASMAAAVYGALAIMTLRPGARWKRILLVGAAAILIGGIAISRLALRVHSVQEIILGLVLGTTASTIFAWRYCRLDSSRRIALPLLCGGSVILLAALFGIGVPYEDFAYDIALTTRTTLRLCPAP